MDCILIIGWVWPEPKASAAGVNMLSLLRDCIAVGARVVFATAAERTPLSYPLASLGIETRAIQVNDSAFDEWVAELNPELVVFDRFLMEEQYGWRVAQACPNALRVLDTEDLQCLREYRRRQASGDNAVSLPGLEITKRELASIWRSDLSLVVSSTEFELLTDTFAVDERMLCLRELHPLAGTDIAVIENASSRSFEQRTGLVTIGNFRHAPNWDSILFIHQLWPELKKRLPELEIHIYGAYMPPKAQQLHNPKQGFYIEGWVEDALEAMSSARVCLAPLRFGAGQKGKLLLAMCAGTPSVTTSLGAESMGQGPWPGEIADSSQEIVQAVVDLYTDSTAWQQASERALALASALKAVHVDAWLLVAKALIKNLPTHRERNFIGAMLNHHQHQSTKYLSRWIEAKNTQ